MRFWLILGAVALLGLGAVALLGYSGLPYSPLSSIGPATRTHHQRSKWWAVWRSSAATTPGD